MVFLHKSAEANEYLNRKNVPIDLRHHLKNKNVKVPGEEEEDTQETSSSGSDSGSLDLATSSSLEASDARNSTQSSASGGIFSSLSAAGTRDKIKELENIQTKVLESLKTLKHEVKDFDKAIDLETDSRPERSTAALNISRRKVQQLEAKRRQTMNAVEYLQKVQNDLRDSIEQATESMSNKTKCRVKVPCLLEIMAHVQTIIAGKITYFEPGFAANSNQFSRDGWYLDDPHKQTRKLTIANAGITFYQRKNQGFPEPAFPQGSNSSSSTAAAAKVVVPLACGGDPSRQSSATTMGRRSSFASLIRSSSNLSSCAPARGMLKHESGTKGFKQVEETTFLNLIGP